MRRKLNLKVAEIASSEPLRVGGVAKVSWRNGVGFTVGMSDLPGQPGYFRLFPNLTGDGTGMDLAVVRIREIH